MKKYAVGLLTVVFLIFTLIPVMASGEAVTIEENGFVCERLRDGNLRLLQYIGDSAGRTINIPSTIAGSQIEQIGAYAFNDCQMAGVTIPDTVKVIEMFAFNGCTEIEKITIPNNVMFISGNPFTGCTSLVNISLDPKHPTMQVTSDGVLYSRKNKMLICYPCSKMDLTFTVLAGTVTIGSYAFSGCNSLESISLPATVTGICEGSFLNCTKLTDITLPESLLSIDSVAFAGCTSLREVSIPNNVTRIETSTFFNCQSLARVFFPESLLTICDRAFYGCAALQEILLPTCITSIGDNAFDGCKSLTDAYIPVTVTSIGTDAFDNCSVKLYMHLDENSYAEIYAKLYDISFTYGNENSFLANEKTEEQQTDAEATND